MSNVCNYVYLIQNKLETIFWDLSGEEARAIQAVFPAAPGRGQAGHVPGGSDPTQRPPRRLWGEAPPSSWRKVSVPFRSRGGRHQSFSRARLPVMPEGERRLRDAARAPSPRRRPGSTGHAERLKLSSPRRPPATFPGSSELALGRMPFLLVCLPKRACKTKFRSELTWRGHCSQGTSSQPLSLAPQALRLRLASQETACSLWKRESCRILQPCSRGWGCGGPESKVHAQFLRL